MVDLTKTSSTARRLSLMSFASSSNAAAPARKYEQHCEAALWVRSRLSFTFCNWPLVMVTRSSCLVQGTITREPPLALLALPGTRPGGVCGADFCCSSC